MLGIARASRGLLEGRLGLRSVAASLRQRLFSGPPELSREIRWRPCSSAIIAGPWPQRRPAPSTVVTAVAPGCAHGLPPVVRAIRACHDCVRAGRRPVGPEGQVVPASGKSSFPGAGLGPVTPVRFTARNPRKSCGIIFFCDKYRDHLKCR